MLLSQTHVVRAMNLSADDVYTILKRNPMTTPDLPVSEAVFKGMEPGGAYVYACSYNDEDGEFLHKHNVYLQYSRAPMHDMYLLHART